MSKSRSNLTHLLFSSDLPDSKLPDSFRKAMASSTATNPSMAKSASSSDLASSDLPFPTSFAPTVDSFFKVDSSGTAKSISSAYRLGFSNGASSQSKSQDMYEDSAWSSMMSEGKSFENSERSSEASVADIKKTRPYQLLRAKYLDSVDENRSHENARIATEFLFNVSDISMLKEWRDFVQRLIESRTYEEINRDL